jgi:uncharacterized phiE125 gp8 family phage protein
MGLVIVTEPTEFPVSLEEAKAHLNVNHSDDDAKIELYIAAATAHIDGPDGWLGRSLVGRTYDLFLDAWPEDGIRLTHPPIIEVEGVFYTRDADGDGVGAEEEFSSGSYVVDTRSIHGWVVPADAGWATDILDTTNAVRVRYRAGYIDTSDSPSSGEVPANIKAGILVLVEMMYDQGQAAVRMPIAAEMLLSTYRIWG